MKALTRLRFAAACASALAACNTSGENNAIPADSSGQEHNTAGDASTGAPQDGGDADGAAEAIDLSDLGTQCVDALCPAGLVPVHYFGVAGPGGPEFCSCEIPCAKNATSCPELTTCQTLSDGPGQVCVLEPEPELRWYATCGNPVCGVNDAPPEAPACAAAARQGAPCAEPPGTLCDGDLGCGAALLCADRDPQLGGMCPRSRALFKQDIAYVGGQQRAALAKQVFELPIATYTYIDDPQKQPQLGFIIEDVEPSPSVDSERDRVNLYAYTTMVVAALQEQQRELEALRAEVRALRAAGGRASP